MKSYIIPRRKAPELKATEDVEQQGSVTPDPVPVPVATPVVVTPETS
jgi:hypothetical protein